MNKAIVVLCLVLNVFVIVGHSQIAVHHLNVGQADATLIETRKAAILIDVGGSGTAGEPDRLHLSQYLEDFFKRRSDLKRTLYSVIISHPHIDHTRYIMDVLDGFGDKPPIRVQNFVDNGDLRQASGSSQLRKAREFIDRKNSERPKSLIYNTVHDKKIRRQGYVTSWFETLAAKTGAEIKFLSGLDDCKNKNNDSVIVLLKYAGTKFIFAGDAEWDEDDETCNPAVPRILRRFQRNGLLDVDVYKVSHHGSVNGTNEALLRAMSPKISVISAGYYEDRQENNGPFDAWNYGHPRR